MGQIRGMVILSYWVEAAGSHYGKPRTGDPATSGTGQLIGATYLCVYCLPWLTYLRRTPSQPYLPCRQQASHADQVSNWLKATGPDRAVLMHDKLLAGEHITITNFKQQSATKGLTMAVVAW